MADILMGAPVSQEIDRVTSEKVTRLSNRGIVPLVHIIRFGDGKDDMYYENGICKKANRLGISVRKTIIDDVSDDVIREKIRDINLDPENHGILCFLPLPKQFSHLDSYIRSEIDTKKDIDCITYRSNASLYMGQNEGFVPCTAQACIEMLKFNNIPVSGKRVVVVGRSLVLGKPLSMLLLNENATVTVCHSKTVHLENLMKDADIVITAIGKLRNFGTECFRKGQIVLDVGMNWDPINGVFSGDVDFNPVSHIVDAITPVPGGIGSITTSILLSHVVFSSENGN